MYKNLIMVPLAATSLVLTEIHNGFAHIALSSLRDMLSSWGVWWPSIKEDTQAFVKSCATCQLKTITSGRVFGRLGNRSRPRKGQEIGTSLTLPRSVHLMESSELSTALHVMSCGFPHTRLGRRRNIIRLLSTTGAACLDSPQSYDRTTARFSPVKPGPRRGRRWARVYHTRPPTTPRPTVLLRDRSAH